MSAVSAGDPVVNRQRLWPWREQVLRWLYSRFVEVCRQRRLVPIYVYLPLPLPGSERYERADEDLARAAEIGFTTIDLRPAYRGRSTAELRVAPWDHHLNGLGHRIAAEALFELLGPEWLRGLAAACGATAGDGGPP